MNPCTVVRKTDLISRTHLVLLSTSRPGAVEDMRSQHLATICIRTCSKMRNIQRSCICTPFEGVFACTGVKDSNFLQGSKVYTILRVARVAASGTAKVRIVLISLQMCQEHSMQLKKPGASRDPYNCCNIQAATQH